MFRCESGAAAEAETDSDGTNGEFCFTQVTKNERQIMKSLYDRYRLVKQILCRASTIPVIVSYPPPPLDCRNVQTLAGS